MPESNEYVNECLNKIVNALAIKTENYEKVRSKIKGELLVCFLLIFIITVPAIILSSNHILREVSIFKLGLTIMMALSCGYLAAYLNAFGLHKYLSRYLSESRYHKFANGGYKAARQLFALIFEEGITEKIEESSISVDWSKKIVFSIIVIIMIIFNMYFPLMVVKGESMEPTFSNGQIGICLDWEKNPTPISLGDIITFDQAVGSGKMSLIKRVIGLPGDRIIITSIGIFRNNERLAEEYLPSKTITSPSMTIDLYENEYFVLGDNRGNSADSRIFGKISGDSITSKLIWVY